MPTGKAFGRAVFEVPEVTRRNTRIHFMQPWKEHLVREVGYGPSLEGASAADLVNAGGMRENSTRGRFMEGSATDVDRLLRAAIEQKRLVELVYSNKLRVLEPHDYGIHKGSVKLLAYQVAGFSSGPLPNWRWIDVRSISDIHLLDRTFPGGRHSPSGKHHQWDQLFLRVKPPDSHHE